MQRWHYDSADFEGTLADVCQAISGDDQACTFGDAGSRRHVTSSYWDVCCIVPDSKPMEGGGPYQDPYRKWTVVFRIELTE